MIGAGWSGLTAALHLNRAGRSVILIEAAAVPGGRARSLEVDGARLDNGQHIVVGACREVRAQITAVGIAPEAAFQALPFGLSLQALKADGGSRSLHLTPSSTHPGALGLALYRALAEEGLRARLGALLGAAQMLHRPLGRDRSVQSWLRERRQPPALIEQLWEPLCLSVMNAPIGLASAQILQNVLRETLLAGPEGARLLIPRQPLGALFPEPALARLRERGASIRLSTRVNGIEVRGDGGFDLRLRDGTALQARQVILATPPRGARRLLPAAPGLDALRGALLALGERAICTVYLRYRQALHHLPPLTGLLAQHGQWLLPRHVNGEPHWVAVVISAPETGPALAAEQRWRRVAQELNAGFPGLGWPESARVVCERQATFDARAGIEAVRPTAHTAQRGLYLAGDYVRPGLPSTLEAAVQGGLQAARAALAERSY